MYELTRANTEIREEKYHRKLYNVLLHVMAVAGAFAEYPAQLYLLIHGPFKTALRTASTTLPPS
jgi:hypothetical protein